MTKLFAQDLVLSKEFKEKRETDYSIRIGPDVKSWMQEAS
jgi:hypothetical protein